MASEQPLYPHKHLILDHENIVLLAMPYVSPRSSSTATSHVVTHSMVGTPTFLLVPFTLGNHLVSLNVLIIICRLSLVGTKVLFSGSQVPIIANFDFRLMIHINVPIYYLANDLPLLVVENLGTEILPFHINKMHHFLDEFAPLTILPFLPKAPQVNAPIEEDIDMCVEEK